MADTQKPDEFEKVNMAVARERLPALTENLTTGKQEAVALCKRDEPAALLVSHSRFAFLVDTLRTRGVAYDRRRIRQLAWLITDNWLGSAPAHLRDPQTAELEQLPVDSLIAIFAANPNQPSRRSELLRKARVDPKIIERLKKRRKVALAIREAEEEGLYEAAEHATSEVGLSDEDRSQ